MTSFYDFNINNSTPSQKFVFSCGLAIRKFIAFPLSHNCIYCNILLCKSYKVNYVFPYSKCIVLTFCKALSF